MKNKLMNLFIAMTIFVCSGCGGKVSYDSFKNKLDKYIDGLTTESYVTYTEENQITINGETSLSNAKVRYRNDLFYLEKYNLGDNYPELYELEELINVEFICKYHYNGDYVEIDRNAKKEDVFDEKVSKAELMALGSDRENIRKENGKYIVNLSYNDLIKAEKAVIDKCYGYYKYIGISSSNYKVNNIELTYLLSEKSVEYTISFDFVNNISNKTVSFYSEREITFNTFNKYSYEGYMFEDNLGGYVTFSMNRSINFDNPFIVHHGKGYLYGYLNKGMYKLNEVGETSTAANAKVYLHSLDKKMIKSLLIRENQDNCVFDKWKSVINVVESGYYFIRVVVDTNMKVCFEKINMDVLPDENIETLKTIGGQLTSPYDYKVLECESKKYTITNTSNQSIFINGLELKAGEKHIIDNNVYHIRYVFLEHNSLSDLDYPFGYSINVESL